MQQAEKDREVVTVCSRLGKKIGRWSRCAAGWGRSREVVTVCSRLGKKIGRWSRCAAG